MNKLKYLFELDSVCKSTYQIQLGQNKLFEEVLFKGNYVVLSYNQLVDSKAFLAAVYNEFTYEQIVGLFKIGVLKVTPFGNMRTASQYLQDCLDRCIKNDADIFLFSGVPLHSNAENKKLLQKVQDALRYSDIGILEEELLVNENKNLEFIIRYIRLILVLSIENLAKNEIKDNSSSNLFLYHVIGLIQQKYMNKNIDSIEDEILKQAIDVLHNIGNIIIAETSNDVKIVERRSKWIDILQNYDEFKALDADVTSLCEIIINLAYNYVIENSISNISLNYAVFGDDNFFADFEKRLKKNWLDFQANKYIRYRFDDADTQIYHDIVVPKWRTAYRILMSVNNYRNNKIIQTDSLLENHLWRRKIYRYFFTMLVTTLAYIGVFVITEQLVDLLKEYLSQYYESAFERISNIKYISQTINIVISTIIFGVLGSTIAKLFKLPDILEGISSIGVGIHDLRVIFRYFIKHKI